MRNEIAEWMLSQATTPEQAKTILGDLLEAQPGPVQFWVAVVRSTASIAVHQPRRVLMGFLWFAYEIGFLGLLTWQISSMLVHLKLANFLLMLAVLVVGWVVGRWERAHGRKPSLLIGAAWLIWFSKHIHAGVSIWVFSLLFVGYPVLMEIRRRRNDPPRDDRPVAG